MDLKNFRKHFGDIVDLVDELNSFDDIPKIKLPTIIVAGEFSVRGEKAIRALAGFALRVGTIVPNPIEYNFVCDPTCSDNEAFCTINDSLVELNISTQYEELVDMFDELKEWGRSTTCKPIVLTIRANCVASIRIVDIRSTKIHFIEILSKYEIDCKEGIAVVVTEEHWREGSRVVWPCYSSGHSEAIRSIRYHILDRLIVVQLTGLRASLRRRLVELEEAIPPTFDDKRKLLSALSARYRNLMNKVAFGFLTPGNLSSRSYEDTLKRVRQLCNRIALEIFSRFPLIVSEMAQITDKVISDFVRPVLETLAAYLLQNHFLLLHAFECGYDGKCRLDCAYSCLIWAHTSELYDKMQYTLIKSVDDNVSSWVPLLEEPGEKTQERLKLRQQIKIMQKLSMHLDCRRE